MADLLLCASNFEVLRYVFNNVSQRVGYILENGYIYDETGRHVGTVHNDGYVYDYENQRIGKVTGNNIKLGAAAYIYKITYTPTEVVNKVQAVLEKSALSKK